LAGLFVAQVIVGEAELDEAGIDRQSFAKSCKGRALEVAEIEVEIEDAIAVLLTLSCLQHLSHYLHCLGRDLAVNWPQGS
jgi:hypothetical protein